MSPYTVTITGVAGALLFALTALARTTSGEQVDVPGYLRIPLTLAAGAVCILGLLLGRVLGPF